MKSKSELGQDILSALESLDEVMSLEVSLHYGQGVLVLGLQAQKPVPIGSDGSRANAEKLRALIIAYRVACDPEASAKMAHALELRARQRRLTEESETILRSMPPDVQRALEDEEQARAGEPSP